MNLDDLNAAARLKEVVTKLAMDAVELRYPRPKFATVVSVDFTTKKIVLTYAGDTTNVTVDGTHLMPVAGGVVRVAGQEGARYVDEVMSGGISISLAAGKSFKLLGGVTERFVVSDAGTITLTGLLDITSATDSITSRGGGAGLRFFDRDLTNDFSVLYRLGNVTYLYNSPSGVNRMSLDDAGVLSVSANIYPMSGNGSALRLGTWSGNTSWAACVEGVSGYMLVGNSDGNVNNSAYLRTKGTGAVRIGANGTDTLAVGNAVTTVTGTLNTTGLLTADDNFITNRACSASDHGSQPISIRSSGTVAGLGLWPTAWGVAPVLRCFKDYGEHIDTGNNAGTGYVSFGALSFTVRSSIALKKNVTRRSKVDRSEAKERFKNARSAVWDDIAPELTLKPNARFKDLNERWVASGKSPLQVKDVSHVDSVPHVCSDEECVGTATEPCGLVKKHLGRRGFVAEELAEWMPEAVHHDANGDAMGIDYSVVTTELVDVVQDIIEENKELKARIKALEVSRI